MARGKVVTKVLLDSSQAAMFAGIEIHNKPNIAYLNFVCVNPMGDLIRPNYISETFGKLLERSGLPHIRFHDLRHSFTSMLIANDVGPKQAQVWLGHSNISTTMDIYAHLDYSVKKSMGVTIGKLLDAEGNEEEDGEEK